MNLSATPDDGQVTLSWTNPANNTITKYQYRRKTDTGTYGSWTDIPNSGDTTTSYTVTGLTNGTEYTFGVRAVNAGGNGAASTVTATPAPVPAAPTNLEAEVRDRRIGLTWDDPGDSTIDEYEYSTDGGSFSVISGSDDTTTSYTVTGLTNGTQYTFAVRAVNNTDDGVESTVTATPLWPAPTGLVATAGQGRVTVEWNNGHSGIGDYFTYVRGPDIVDRTKFLPRGSGSTTTAIVYPLTNGILYTFSVRALHGKESSTVTARPVSMPAPDNLTATAGDDRQTTLSWSDPGNDAIYKYQVSIDNGTTFTDISDSSKSTTTTTVTGLTNGTGYTLAVRGVNWWGYGAASTATATPLWPAPTNLVATPDSSRVFLEWDRNPGITDYRVDVSDGSSVSVSAGSGSKTIAAIDSLANGTAYTFTVLATQDSAQDSADSSWPAAVDATPMVVSPDAPTNLSATPSNSQATLSWDDPGNNTITKYQVSRDGGTSFTNISDSGASTTTTTVTGLTNGTLYTFAVRAENASGRGLAATTTATPVNDAPTASAKTVSTDEDTAYTFKGADFGFTSVKSGATLNHMKITALPGADKGTLSVGGTAITGVTTPRQVTKTGLDAGNLTYTPPANANGAAFATFAFKVNDGVADSDMAYTITINVNAVNDPLTGSDKTVSTDEDFSYTFGEADFAFSDVDAGATLGHVKITSLPGSNQGTLSVGDTPIASVSPPLQVTKDELGTLTYTPPTNAFGAAFATFNFKVSDGTDDSDKAYTITIDVNAVNDPPVAVTDNAETSEDIPVVIGVLENDSDVDPGTALRVVEVGFPTAPSKGTAAINPNNTTVTYTPNANVTGTDTFSYAVTDGFDTSNVEVAVEILGSGTNANLSNLTLSSGTLMPDFAATTTSYEVDVEAPTDSVRVTPTTADAQATVTVNGALVDSGKASDEIRLSEGVGATTDIDVEVTAQNSTTKTYTITVTQTLSANANLSGLTISSGTLTPVLAVGTTDYRVDVGNAVASVTVTPTTEHADATVTVNGMTVANGSASGDIDLIAGDTTPIAVVVTAANGMDTKAYAMGVRRAEADLERPEVTIEGPTEPVGMAGFEVTITFSEPVEGFEPEDIQVSNGMVADFTEASSSEYRATIKPAELGQPVVVEVPEDVAEDGAGNGNRAAEAFEVETKLVVSYQEESYTATEGGEAVTVTVKLSQGWDEELAIPIRVTRPETTEAADYTLDGLEEWDAQEGTGRLTFPAEETEQTFTIEANHDGDGDDETVELGFGELPEIVLAGEPGVATVTLEDKGLVELEVSFGQAAYQIGEGQQADIEVKAAPTADRRVEVPLVVVPKGGATDEDYSGVPAKVVLEEGESEGTISVEVLMDDVDDPGEGLVLSMGALPQAVSAGEPASTEVHFEQPRMAERFSQTLEVALAVIARSTAVSAQTAIEGRFERHRQWSRLGSASGALPTPQPGSDHSAAALSPRESERIGRAGAGGRGVEGSVVHSAWGAARTSAAMGSGWNAENRETGTPGSWLRSLSLGSLGNLASFDPTHLVASPGSGMEPSGSVYRQDLDASGVGAAPLAPGSGDFSGMRGQAFSLSGVSFEMSSGESEQATSWVPVLWGQGDLQHFDGDLRRLGMAYRGGLEAAHVGLDLYANDQMLAGLSFMRSWGDLDYTADGIDGVLESRMTTVHPYLDLQHFDGDLRRLGMAYRGGLEAAHVGLDLYANDQMLAGLSFMRSWGDLDYTADGIDGVLESRMTTVHPYLYWQPSDRLSVWGIGGLGGGQVAVEEPGRTHDFDADFRMLAGGVRAVLSRRGSHEWGLRGDGFTAQLETGALADIAKVSGEAHRGRLLLDWVHDRALSAGRSLSLQVEAGGRFDGGDAERGSGLETGFRLGYLDAHRGLDVALHGRVLVVHASDYRDWGVGVQASWDPGEKQRGFRASVTSSWGRDGGGQTTLWDNADAVMRPVGMGAMEMGSQYRMESEVAYGGLKALGLPGLLTPYSRLRWAGQGRELALGTAWSLPTGSRQAPPLLLELETIRRETQTGPADLAVLARLSLPF